MVRKILLISLLFYLSTTVQAQDYGKSPRRVVYNGKQIIINTCKNRSTEILFPNKIGAPITALHQNQITIEKTEKALYIMPIYKPEGDIFVPVGGITVPLYIKNVPEENRDVRVEIITPVEMRGSYQVGGTKAGTGISTVNIFKMLFTGTPLPAAIEIEQIENEELWTDNKIKMILTKAWDVAGNKACEGLVINLSNKPQVVPIQYIEKPGLIGIATEQDVLEKKQSCKLWVLIKE